MGGCYGKRFRENDSEDNSVQTVNERLENESNFINIQSLTDYDLIEIFRKLDFESKVRAQSVCQRWYQLIEKLFDEQKFVLISTEIVTNEVQWYTNWFGLKSDTNKSYIYLKQMPSIYSTKRIRFIISKHKRIENIILHLNARNLVSMKSKESLALKRILHQISQSCNKGLLSISIIYFCEDSADISKIILRHDEVKAFCYKFKHIQAFEIESDRIFVKEKSIGLMFKTWNNIKSFKLNGFPYNREKTYGNSKFSGNCFENLNKDIERLAVHSSLLNSKGLSILANKRMPRLDYLWFFRIESDIIPSFRLIGDCFESIKTFLLDTDEEYSHSDDVIMFFETFSKLNNLGDLMIESDSRSSHIIYNQIINQKYLKYWENLKAITITDICVKQNLTEKFSECVPQLEKLVFDRIKLIGSAKIFWKGIENMKNLRFLEISFGINSELKFTVLDLILIINSCHHLTSICVSKCDQITCSNWFRLNAFPNRDPNEIITITTDAYFKNQIHVYINEIKQLQNAAYRV